MQKFCHHGSGGRAVVIQLEKAMISYFRLIKIHHVSESDAACTNENDHRLEVKRFVYSLVRMDAERQLSLASRLSPPRPFSLYLI